MNILERVGEVVGKIAFGIIVFLWLAFVVIMIGFASHGVVKMFMIGWNGWVIR